MKGWISRNLLSGIPLVKWHRGVRIIFLYHDVSERTAPYFHPTYSTEPLVFAKQIAWIKSKFQMVGLDELVDSASEKTNRASIVFDDGFLSVHDVAWPFLASQKIPFTLFLNRSAVENNWLWSTNVLVNHKNQNMAYLKRVYQDHFPDGEVGFDSFVKDPVQLLIDCRKSIMTASCIDQDLARVPGYVTEVQLKAMIRGQVSIGSHTASHTILAACSDEELKEEIETNNGYLEHLVKRKINHFAIPFGFDGTFDDRTIQIAGRMHANIYTTQRSLVSDSRQRPRMGMRNDTVKSLTENTNRALLRHSLGKH